MLSKPTSVSPRLRIGEMRPPNEGKLALQLESGVLTTTLQFDNSEDTTNCKGSNNIEKIPELFVVTLDTTFPFPH